MPRRRRRSQEDILKRIRDAAQALFAEHGYGATTTREIARVADVSQTLIFNHYGDKAGLFDEVVSAPFRQLMTDFAQRHQDHAADGDRETDLRQMVARLFALFDANRDLMSALLNTAAFPSGTDPQPPHGLEAYFEDAVHQIELHFEGTGTTPRFDIRVAAPLAFGMIAASALLKHWLFPKDPPSAALLTETLGTMIVDSFTPTQHKNAPTSPVDQG